MDSLDAEKKNESCSSLDPVAKVAVLQSPDGMIVSIVVASEVPIESVNLAGILENLAERIASGKE